jgi:hypothetical protein
MALYGGEWSIQPLKILRMAECALPQGGLLSPVYMDGVVRAMIPAAKRGGRRSTVYYPWFRDGRMGEVLSDLCEDALEGPGACRYR